jgi:hypothetical protein
LSIPIPEEINNHEHEIEMKEDILTANIAAIASYTQGITSSYPRWIAVRIKFQKYRFLTFKKLQNDFFLYFLSEGNLDKIEIVESVVEPLLRNYIDKIFNGDLRTFNELKTTLRNLFKKFPERKFY